MKTEKWRVTTNDGDVVTLCSDLEDTYEEATLQRPDNVSASEWQTRWPLGEEIGADEYHDRIRLESLRRKDAGDLTASAKWAVERWNRPDPVRKRCSDLMEKIRVYLKSTEEVSMLDFVRLLYLKHAAKNPGIASDYAAINSEASLYAFISKYECPVEDGDTMEELLNRAEREGFWKGRSC
jgi:hypothetical protein